ncbi:hypothetical protein [Metabacillus sediminilitoris]|uniref:Uncharacterized protein n=1 Tax=Metabacillus sediminilitoris TaxID=2567941 RepID=A0A4S4BX16_9BACI|nr:hypothetical protein [Metabacillus sediminilitoris]QGQ45970.1 hypothetical protein GMB29_12470 [Metabacillus sediminilitoris]THF79654.1 hypothetical protein E6W99_11590 [Metabacillus sediminilitoris]
MSQHATINLWFNILIFLFGGYLAFRLPQRLPKSVAALIMTMCLAIALGLDHSIGVPPIDLYDTNIEPWLTLTEIPTWGMYPISGYLYIYLFDKLNVRGYFIPLYILCWSIFGTLFEGLGKTFKVFVHKDWELRYSFLVYLFTQILTTIVFKILMKTYRKKGEG